jgi:uncharacterized protein (TIRG00374 family)
MDDGIAPAARAGQPAPQGFFRRHRRLMLTALGALLALGFVYYVVPQIAGLGGTLRRLRGGNPWWLGLGVPLETLSIVGYVALFRGVFSGSSQRIDWKVSAQVTLAGGAATKLLAAAGAGGVALTVWALRAAGIPADVVAGRMVGFEILNYAVYMGALALGGVGLWIGLFPGRAPLGLTLVPGLAGAGVIVIVLLMPVIANPLERAATKRAQRSKGRMGRWWGRAASFPRALLNGLHIALAEVRRRDPSLLGAIAAWGFDIATLWASFRAFGPAPPVAVLVMGYFVGTLGNTLPLPGGIGGVEGGMIGSFLAFGVNGSLAVIAVLAYRTISYWLPTLPGAIAYAQLRRTVGVWHDDDPKPKAGAAASLERPRSTGT